MIKYYRINAGFHEIPEMAPGCWINITSPEPSEVEFIVKKFNIPDDLVGDISDVDERPRMEIDDDWRLIILRIPHVSGDVKLPFITIPMGILFNGDVIITLCYFETTLIPDFIEHKKRKKIVIRNPFDFFFYLNIASSVWYLKSLKQINQRIGIAENKLEKSIKNEELQNLLNIEKSLVFFITSLKANHVMLNKVKSYLIGKKNMDEQMQELIEDALIESQQAVDLAEIHSNIMSGMMDAFASVIANNLNVVIKRLTSISVVLMVPTLVASIYGMNVPNGLERHPYAFAMVCAASLLISVGSILFFRKEKWL